MILYSKGAIYRRRESEASGQRDSQTTGQRDSRTARQRDSETAGQRDSGVGRIPDIFFYFFLLILFPMFLSQLGSDKDLRVALCSSGWRMTISEPQAGGWTTQQQPGRWAEGQERQRRAELLRQLLMDSFLDDFKAR